MKAYGFSDTDIYRGEISFVRVEKQVYQNEAPCLMRKQGWFFISRTFSATKRYLISKMKEHNIDDELISSVQDMKAIDIAEIDV